MRGQATRQRTCKEKRNQQTSEKGTANSKKTGQTARNTCNQCAVGVKVLWHMKRKIQSQTSDTGTTNKVKEQGNGSNGKKVHMQGKRQSQTSDKGTAKSTQHAIRARFYRKTLAQRNGALVANVVIPKLYACEGLVDLRTRKQKNAAWSMVTGG